MGSPEPPRKKLPELGSSSSAAASAVASSTSSPAPSSRPSSNRAKKPKPSPAPIEHHPSASPSSDFEQLNFDEGYSGEKTPTPYDDGHPGLNSTDVKIPPWMTGLQPDIREEYAFKLVRSLPTSNIASLVHRLVPILHLDFIQFLPTELSLHILSYLPPKSLLNAALTSRQWRRYALEPSLWKALYHRQGWESNEEEVKRFEREMRERTEAELRQRDEALRRQDGSPGSDPSMSFSHQTDGPGPETGQVPYYATNSASDEEELYPTPLRSFQPMVPDLSLTIVPTLLAPGYHPANPPRLNWAFLFKHRKRLEENWRRNKCEPFQIPHRNYAHEAHRECVYTISYSPKWLVSGSRDKTIRIWDLQKQRLRGPPLEGHDASVLCLQFDEHPDEDIIISGSSDANVIVWRFSTGEMLHKIRKAHDESVLNLRFNKKWLITCSKDKLIKIWNRQILETQDPDYPWNSKTLFGPSDKVPRYHPHHPEYNPSFVVQDPAASSGLNLSNPFANPKFAPRTLSPYHVVNELRGHTAAVNAIQLHDDEVVSASGDRTIKLWSLKTGLCQKTYIGHDKGIACIQYDGKTIVSGSSDQTIRLFDRDTQAEIFTLRGHQALVRTVQATKNKIISGSYDESVRIWTKEDNEEVWTEGPILKQAYSPVQVPPPHAPYVQMQQAALQQFQQNNGAPQATVVAHQVQPVGTTGLLGAMVASQLLGNHNQHHHHHHHNSNNASNNNNNVNTNNQAGPSSSSASSSTATPQPTWGVGFPPGAQPPANSQTVYNSSFPNGIPAHVLSLGTGQAPLLTNPPPAPAPPANPTGPIGGVPSHPALAAAAAAAAAIGGGPGHQQGGAHRVFKLQFDSRWIICCSQHTRIVGWDYAAGDEGIKVASRFFAGA